MPEKKSDKICKRVQCTQNQPYMANLPYRIRPVLLTSMVRLWFIHQLSPLLIYLLLYSQLDGLGQSTWHSCELISCSGRSNSCLASAVLSCWPSITYWCLLAIVLQWPLNHNKANHCFYFLWSTTQTPTYWGQQSMLIGIIFAIQPVEFSVLHRPIWEYR